MSAPRSPLVSLVIYIAVVVALVLVGASIASLLVSTPAGSATCITKPGRSHGPIWWRWRYSDNGGRCWYPGSRYAKRARYIRIARAPQIRSQELTSAKGGEASAYDRGTGTRSRGNISETMPRQFDSGEEVAGARTVRVIPIYGRSTVHERIERAFDKLITFPIEDEP